MLKSATVTEILYEKIKTKTARIGVIGLGYVGLPLAVEFARNRFIVKGFDIDPNKVDYINKGNSYIEDVPTEKLLQLMNQKQISATTNFALLSEMDVVFICVPTPFTETKDPDISYIQSATEQLIKHSNGQHLIILESTTYPGTTEEVVQKELENSGLKVEEDFFLAFSPERVDPGNKQFNIKNTPKVVGGVTEDCTNLAALLYQKIIGEDFVYKVGSPKVAELTKLLENTFRSVNIALVNELALLCRRMKIDVWEVIDAAATKPFGYMPFYPGPGVGGHCIPVDPYYLSWKAREYDFDTKFIQLSADINNNMPQEVVNLLHEELNKIQRPINGSNILIIGASFKNDIGDIRNSASIRVMDLLLSKGANLSYHDPYVPKLEFSEKHKEVVLESIAITKDFLAGIDCIVILTNHTNVNYEMIVNSEKKVIDTKNALKDYKNRMNIVKL